MIKFKTSTYDTTISPIEVVRETAQFVYFKRGSTERREAKASGFDAYHDSWEAAHQHLMERTAAAVERARRSLQIAQDNHGNVKGMKKPEAATDSLRTSSHAAGPDVKEQGAT